MEKNCKQVVYVHPIYQMLSDPKPTPHRSLSCIIPEVIYAPDKVWGQN